MFISDALYEILYRNGVGNMPGFYDGQIVNYILFASMAVFGFIITKINFSRIFIAALAAPTTYFLLSNFIVWIGGGGYQRPKTFSGLMMSYADGWPFYLWSVAATLFFSAVLFGTYYLFTQKSSTREKISMIRA
jgi:hypothetical protein